MKATIFAALLLIVSTVQAQDWLPTLSYAVVRVVGPPYRTSPTMMEQNVGSGTVVQINTDSSRSGMVITAKHVVPDNLGNSVTISWRDGYTSSGVVTARGAAYDTAVISVRSTPPNCIAIRIAEQEPQTGDTTIAIGYGGQYGTIAPRDFRQVYWSSRVIGYVNDGNTRPIKLTGPYALSGDSGGPILNARGVLIGVISARGDTYVVGPYCTPIRNLLFGRRPPIVVQQQRPG